MSCLTYLALLVFAFTATTSGLDAANAHNTVLSFDASGAKSRPVSKVITLLKDMLKQFEQEQEEDEQIYEKLACWCAANDKEKTQAIKDAEARISDLSTQIEEHTASSSRLSTEISALSKEVAQSQESLDGAVSMRTKQHGAFVAEDTDLRESISALKSAIVVLSKHQSGALFQIPRSRVLAVAATLQHEMQKHGSLLQGVLTPTEKRIATEFVQDQEDSKEVAQTSLRQNFAPQSGEILGILKQMLETFQASQSQAEKEEMGNQQAFSGLKEAKMSEIGASSNQVDTKKQELATVNEKKAQAKQDLDDTKNSLSADDEFLMMLKEKCSMNDQEWEERRSARQAETQAVSKALAVLSSDDAHDVFTRTFNPAFLQKEAQGKHHLREQASKVLSAAAKRLNKPFLMTLAYQVRIDAFTKVKKAIDDMMAELKQEKADEIKHKDFCTDEFNSNAAETESVERQKQNLAGKMDDLQMTITGLVDAIASLQSQVKEMQVQLKRAGEDREKQNKEFQSTITDQQETQRLLKVATGVLKDFYAKSSPSLLQQEPAPGSFSPYKKSSASGGVVALLQQILSDARSMEQAAVKSEEDAQKAYEAFVQDTNRSIRTKSKEMVNKSEEKATAESDLVTTREDKNGAMVSLEQLSNYNAELHSSCDFILKNFEVRQTARDEEVEALKQAKAILSGANFNTLLQG